MFGAGTLINAAAIVSGGLLGLLCGNHLQTILICACGLRVLLIGADGVFEKMLTVNGSALSSSGAMMLIVSLCLGGLAGELVGIAQATDRLGEWLKRKSGSSRDPYFVIGFVNASFTVSVGAMAVLGPIQDVLYGDLTTLLIKSVLDGVLVFAMAASYGKGCLFSVLPMVAGGHPGLLLSVCLAHRARFDAGCSAQHLPCGVGPDFWHRRQSGLWPENPCGQFSACMDLCRRLGSAQPHVRLSHKSASDWQRSTSVGELPSFLSTTVLHGSSCV